MPQEYTIDTQQQVIWARCWGCLSDQDLLAHQAALRADPKFNNLISQLVDAREVTELEVSTAAVNKLGTSTLFAPTAKRAYVVTQNALFGLIRMYEQQQAVRGVSAVRVFRDRALALAWLGVSDPSTITPENTGTG